MLKRFFPKQPNFFKHLSRMAEIGHLSATALLKVTDANANPESISNEIGKLEHESDAEFRTSLNLLTDTFITPIEREDLHSLFLATDDVSDGVHAVAQRIVAYRLTRFHPGTVELFKLTVEATSQLKELISRIDEIKAPAELHRVSREINRTGSKVEAQVRVTLAALYDSTVPISDILKERDIVNMVQDITNSAEKVTTIMEEVLLGQA